MKKLTKSNNKLITGVCGGIAEYFNIDATVVRLIFAILAVITKVFPIAIIYVIAAIIMPDADFENDDARKIESGEKPKRTSSRNKKSGNSESTENHRSDKDFDSYFEK